MKKVLFIDRDGTILEEPADEQIDTVEKFRYLPYVISSLSFLRKKTDYEFVMVTNQDGLGTPANPQEVFDQFQTLMLHTLKMEGVEFDDIRIADFIRKKVFAFIQSFVNLLKSINKIGIPPV